MNLFFDTSALVKIFHDEAGSIEIRNIYIDEKNIYTYWILLKLNIIVHCTDVSAIKKYQKSNLEIAKIGFDKELSQFLIQQTSALIIEEAKILLFLYGRNGSANN